MSEAPNHSSPSSVHSYVQSVLNRAETLCQQRGVRWTALRRRVLEIILSSPHPLGAYEILDVLQQEKGHTAPPTVYRALGFLLEQNLVHRVSSLGAYLGCHYPQYSHKAQFMICRYCGEVIEIADTTIKESSEKVAANFDFEVEDQIVEITGRCGRCRQVHT
jgi:Fur family zinc uptake transcriptional regulator